MARFCAHQQQFWAILTHCCGSSPFLQHLPALSNATGHATGAPALRWHESCTSVLAEVDPQLSAAAVAHAMLRRRLTPRS
jgi:hypothetical protein